MSTPPKLRAGMHSIEHFYYSDFRSFSFRQEKTLRRNCLRPRKKETSLQAQSQSEAVASFSSEKADALWNKLKTNKTWVTPTLEEIYAAGHPAAVPWTKNLSRLSRTVLKSWRGGAA